MHPMKILVYLTLMILLIACGGNNTESNVAVPGEPKDSESKALELGAAVVQNKSPLKEMNMYLNGFHFYNGNIRGQIDYSIVKPRNTSLASMPLSPKRMRLVLKSCA